MNLRTTILLLALSLIAPHPATAEHSQIPRRDTPETESAIQDILYTQTLTGTRKDYRPQEYVCWNFANDNCEQFRALGYSCSNFNFGCISDVPLFGTTTLHSANLIDFTDQTVEPGARRICLVEPQRCMSESARDDDKGAVVGCWIIEGRYGDRGTSYDPSLDVLHDLMQSAMKEFYPWYARCADSFWSDRYSGRCDKCVNGNPSDDHSKVEG